MFRIVLCGARVRYSASAVREVIEEGGVEGRFISSHLFVYLVGEVPRFSTIVSGFEQFGSSVVGV